jgi:hypothetical protein
LLDGDKRKVVLLGKSSTFWQTGHRTIGIHDFCQKSDGLQAGKPAEVDGDFGVASAFQYSAIASNKRENVTRTSVVLSGNVGFNERAECKTSIY